MSTTKDFLQFLFVESQQEAELEASAEELAAMFEKVGEAGDLKQSKQPLKAALKALDLDLDPVEDHVGFVCDFDTLAEYDAAKSILHDVSNLTKLAELGWVPVFNGEVTSQDAPPVHRIGFLEITVGEPAGEPAADIPGSRKGAEAAQAAAWKANQELTPASVDGNKKNRGKVKESLADTMLASPLASPQVSGLDVPYVGAHGSQELDQDFCPECNETNDGERDDDKVRFLCGCGHYWEKTLGVPEISVTERVRGFGNGTLVVDFANPINASHFVKSLGLPREEYEIEYHNGGSTVTIEGEDYQDEARKVAASFNGKVIESKCDVLKLVAQLRVFEAISGTDAVAWHGKIENQLAQLAQEHASNESYSDRLNSVLRLWRQYTIDGSINRETIDPLLASVTPLADDRGWDLQPYFHALRTNLRALIADTEQLPPIGQEPPAPGGGGSISRGMPPRMGGEEPPLSDFGPEKEQTPSGEPTEPTEPPPEGGELPPAEEPLPPQGA